MQFESTNQKILQVECMLHCECVLRWHEFSYIFAPMNYLLLLLARKIVLFWALLSMVRFLFPFFPFVFVLLFCSIQFIYLWFFSASVESGVRSTFSLTLIFYINFIRRMRLCFTIRDLINYFLFPFKRNGRRGFFRIFFRLHIAQHIDKKLDSNSNRWDAIYTMISFCGSRMHFTFELIYSDLIYI